MPNHDKKETMIKTRVGCVKSCAHNGLPETGFVYGRANLSDAEGAGAGTFLIHIRSPNLYAE